MDADRLIEAIEEAGFTARDYSGRGMYGRVCVGFTTGDLFKAGVAVAMAAALAADEGEERGAMLDLQDLSVRTDQMGFDVIVYFPGVAWPEGRAREDEEDAA